MSICKNGNHVNSVFQPIIYEEEIVLFSILDSQKKKTKKKIFFESCAVLKKFITGFNSEYF